MQVIRTHEIRGLEGCWSIAYKSLVLTEVTTRAKLCRPCKKSTLIKKFVLPIQQELGWFSVKDQLLVHAVIQMYKIVKGNAPLYLSSSNSKRSDVHNYNTRQSVNLNLS